MRRKKRNSCPSSQNRVRSGVQSSSLFTLWHISRFFLAYVVTGKYGSFFSSVLEIIFYVPGTYVLFLFSNPMYDSLWALSTMGGNYGPLAERVLGGGTVPSPPPTSEPSPPGPLPQVSLLGCVFFACGNISYLLLYNNSRHDKVRTVTSGKIFYDINQLPVPAGTIRILLKVLVIRILKYPHHIAGSRTATSPFGNGSGSTCYRGLFGIFFIINFL